MDATHYRLMTNPKAGSRNLLANIPEDGSALAPPAGPWKFWKDASTPRFPQTHGYWSLGPFFVYPETYDGLALKQAGISAGSNFAFAATQTSSTEWQVSNRTPSSLFTVHDGLDNAPSAWQPYMHCEKLLFSSNCFLAEDGDFSLGSPTTWLKPAKGAGFDPAFGRPYSGAGGFNSAGVVADDSNWWRNPSKIKPGPFTEDSTGNVSGTESRWRWIGDPPEMVKANVSYGPYDTKFLCAVCFKKVAETWEAFPLYWTASSGAPDGHGLDNYEIGLKMLAAGFPTGIHFDIRIHYVVWGAQPPRGANEVYDGTPLTTHDSALPNNHYLVRPDNLYWNTQVYLTARIVSAVAI